MRWSQAPGLAGLLVQRVLEQQQERLALLPLVLLDLPQVPALQLPEVSGQVQAQLLQAQLLLPRR